MGSVCEFAKISTAQSVNSSIRFYRQTANQPHSIDLNIQHSTEWVPWSMIWTRVREKKSIFQIYISLNFNHNFTTTDCSWFTPSLYFRTYICSFERFFYSVRNVLSNGVCINRRYFVRVLCMPCFGACVSVYKLCRQCRYAYVWCLPGIIGNIHLFTSECECCSCSFIYKPINLPDDSNIGINFALATMIPYVVIHKCVNSWTYTYKWDQSVSPSSNRVCQRKANASSYSHTHAFVHTVDTVLVIIMIWYDTICRDAMRCDDGTPSF